ncbi:MAG: carbohydrate kinase family protein, partial [Patescibacteria group bacterium]|nr:carbohydrate kinase family protein [Patescibacteria group bacterium]
MKIWVSGSLAYDRIMDYPGRFAKHINPKKLHIINLSFAAKTLNQSFGGTAGNIAYGLRLLKVPVGVIGAVGKDGVEYLRRLQKFGADTACVQIFRNTFTAGAYMITDRDDNQITAFFAGVMEKKSRLPEISLSDLAIVSPDSAANMAKLSDFYRRKKISYIFDPGQAITALKTGQLKYCLKNCLAAIGNDYEIDIILKRSKYHFTSSQILITTLGDKGSKIFAEGRVYRIPAARPTKVVDPTGAGDAYRSGLIKGMLEGYSWDKTGKLASVVAVYAVEKYGTQNHKFSWGGVKKRYF